MELLWSDENKKLLNEFLESEECKQMLPKGLGKVSKVTISWDDDKICFAGEEGHVATLELERTLKSIKAWKAAQ